LFNCLLRVSVIVMIIRYKNTGTKKYATKEASSVEFVSVFFDLIILNTYDRNV
jgi:hypothetical protein